jgi:hypothetical protein
MSEKQNRDDEGRDDDLKARARRGDFAGQDIAGDEREQTESRRRASSNVDETGEGFTAEFPERQPSEPDELSKPE